MENKFVKREKEILDFWQDNKIFEKSLKKDSPKGDYVFYDGPPFATGTPHYGHIPSSIMKDVVPRFWTMRGYRVERKWGWDTHGLPIENIVEKELGFKTKKEIEKYGIDKFNEACRSKVLEYADVWKKFIPRLGRWADMENAYKTMDLDYMESIWWVFKELWDKDLIYQDYKSMHICPRCETTLSQSEVTEGYKDITDRSVIAKFELKDEPGTYILAWTTTPWTLPGNVALALGKKIGYVKVKADVIDSGIGSDEGGNLPTFKQHTEFYILAKDNVEEIFGNIRVRDKIKSFEIVDEIKAGDLEGKEYEPLFDYFVNVDLPNKENIYTIQLADFVTVEDGTGVVHIAPGFGEDDMNLAKEKNLPTIKHVKPDGRFTDEIKDWPGELVKPKDDTRSIDKEIVEYLESKGLVFKAEDFTHSYPHCWRCETPLLNYSTDSWFVNVTKIKNKLENEAKDINWSPAHLKEGRFGQWLEGARDWAISRQRFWASVMPIWICDECGEKKVYGSVAELEKDSNQKITDLHKHIIDKVIVPCGKCKKEMHRIPDVLDTWFDSGSMPYAQIHYPFENQDWFEENFPAQFIAEGVDQTRAWFYYLHIIAAAIKGKPAFQNVIANGIVLAEDGKKMSKRLQNYPEPDLVIDQYGADALRYYFLTSPVMMAETLNFSEKGVKEALQKTIMLVGNVLSFYLIYKPDQKFTELTTENILDRWILAKLNLLKQEVTKQMEKYDLVRSARPIGAFINELSTWYVRRSRDRFKSGDKNAVATLGYVLLELSKVMAPFMPFIAEDVYKKVGGQNESVHLDQWPEVDVRLIDKKLLEEMELARQIVEHGLAARAEAGIKVRQPLIGYATSLAKELPENIIQIIKDELNVKKLNFGKDTLDTELTNDLKMEGTARELIRQINQLRKEEKLTINDKVIVYYEELADVFSQFGGVIKKATLADEIAAGSADKMKAVEGGKIGIKKV